MSEQASIERLDAAVEAILAGGPPAGGFDAEIAQLAAVAAELRGLPTERFRTTLRADLERRASMVISDESVQEISASARRVPRARAGLSTLTPYVIVDRPDDLIDFVSRAFGGQETFRATGSAGGLHAEIRLDDSLLMFGGGVEGIRPMPTALHYYVRNADAVYERALAAGASSLQAPIEQPYGDREAGVRDPSGNEWYIATHLAGGLGRYRPEGFHAVTPYLHPRGAGELARFLVRAFGAEELERYESPDGVVQHAKLRFGDSILEMGEAHAQWQPKPTTFYLYVEDVDSGYERALRAGAVSVAPPRDQPYGERNAAVSDPGENVWYLAAPVA